VRSALRMANKEAGGSEARTKKTVKTVAKTAEKTATKGKDAGAATRSPAAGAAKKAKKEVKRNPLPKQRKGLTLAEVIETLPQPANFAAADRSAWLHRNGIGLKFMRQTWARYENPCYWEVTRLRPSLKAPHRTPGLWGIKYWQGQRLTGDRHKMIPSVVKRGWRLLVDEQTPALTASNPATPKHRWGMLEYPHRETMQHWMKWREANPKVRPWGTATSSGGTASSNDTGAATAAAVARTPTLTTTAAAAASPSTSTAASAST